jgi:hypothetical protein
LDKAIVLDNDIASASAKIERPDLLLRLFSDRPVFITPRIFEEHRHLFGMKKIVLLKYQIGPIGNYGMDDPRPAEAR